MTAQSAPQEILPPEDTPANLPANPGRPSAFELDDILPEELEFTPVARHGNSKGVFDDKRQRQFINALAACGSVTTAARAVSMSMGQVYTVRNKKGAESFAAAWDLAVQRGARQIRDTLIDHAINGTPEYIYKDGQLVAERRHFNTRSMMWLVAHQFPEEFGGTSGLSEKGGMSGAMQKLKAKWRAEWEEEWRDVRLAEDKAAKEKELEEINSINATITRIVKKYQAKIREEHYFRCEGNTIGADFALRQMTQLEVMLSVCGASAEMIKDFFHNAPHDGPWSTPVCRQMEEARHAAWAECAAETGIAYERPKMMFYLTEADKAAELAAYQAIIDSREDKGAQIKAYKESRTIHSADVGEDEDTYLPRE